jgi:hypothetical protein
MIKERLPDKYFWKAIEIRVVAFDPEQDIILVCAAKCKSVICIPSKAAMQNTRKLYKME